MTAAIPRQKPDRHGADSAEKHLVIDVWTNLIGMYIPYNLTVGQDYTKNGLQVRPTPTSAPITKVGKLVLSKLDQISYLILFLGGWI